MSPALPRAKRVLILELTANGHHATYVRWIMEAGFAATADIILAARREMFEHPEIIACRSSFTPHLIEVNGKLEAQLADFSSWGLLRSNWTLGRLYRKICRDLAKVHAVDHVIVPFVDDCLVGLGAARATFQGIPWTAITMRSMFHYAEMGVTGPRQRFTGFRRLMVFRLLKQRNLRCLFTIDPTLATYAQRSTAAFMRKLVYLPDPGVRHTERPTQRDARLQFGVPADVRLILLYGEISARKGVDFLLEAAADPRCSREVHVMLAGRCKERARLVETPAYRSLQKESRLHAVEGYVSSAQEGVLLAAADAMWLGYTDFYGMSGVMVLAGRHGLPVLASTQGLIGYLARQHDLGVLIEPRDRASVVEALNRWVVGRELLRRAGERGLAAFQEHDVAELQRRVTSAVNGGPVGAST